MHVQVAIIGAGPAGLLLGQILHANGIDAIVLERRDQAYVEGRIRAGVLEQGTVDMLDAVGVGERLRHEGLVHGGFHVSLDGTLTHVDLAALTGGKHVTIYGQTEVVKDLIAARVAAGAPLVFEAEDVRLHELESDRPTVRWRRHGEEHSLTCDFVAGCDGFHGVSRRSIPADRLKLYERTYPYAWLGILAEAPPAADELIYATHPRGFALFSMRSPALSRNYIQCAPDEDLADWPDARIWEELRLRLGPDGDRLVHEGPVRDKGITPMRSFVAEPMRHGRLFLAGDAAHIVPPTGAKGLNLAASDVHYLSEALMAFYRTGDAGPLDRYSATALARVWKASRFSLWMTSLLHKATDVPEFDARIRRAELDYVLSSRAAMTALAENYVGLPF